MSGGPNVKAGGQGVGGNAGLAFELAIAGDSVKNRQGGRKLRFDLAFSFGYFSLRLRQRKVTSTGSSIPTTLPNEEVVRQ
ncbi:hypothetical protein ACFQZI_10155 [Mucilaginibacter lutimaris]|uniref:Uncharacterized protein n=1 Tax=Mucilaginibacter lutimaris TaxID=931629 RepID=A0ABW2ZGA2_9SPHI